MSRRVHSQVPTISGHHSVSASARSSISSSVSLPLTDRAIEASVNRTPPVSIISTTISVESEADLTLPEMLDPQKIYKAFLDAQKTIVELQEENKKLKALNLDLTLAASTSKRTSRLKKSFQPVNTAGTTDDSESVHLLDLVRNIQKLGQHHQLFWCVILDVSQFSRENCPQWKWDDFEIRYSSPELQKQGPTAELYAVIPPQYHELMALSAASDSGKNFVKQFRNAMSQSRSTSLTALRSYSSLIFDHYNFSPEFFESKYDREQVPGIRKLLGCTIADAATNTFKYARFPPVICKGDDPDAVNKRFLNPILFQVARAVIFGKAAIKSKSAAVGRASSMYLRPDKYAKTTVGLIAWVSMMTRFILSKDTSFDQTGVGNLTKTVYYSDYDFYKHWILRALSQNPDWATSLFAKWDAEVFSHHNKAPGRTPDIEGETIRLGDDADDIARDMDALVIDDSDQEATGINVHIVDAGHPNSVDSIDDSDIYASDDPVDDLMNRSTHIDKVQETYVTAQVHDTRNAIINPETVTHIPANTLPPGLSSTRAPRETRSKTKKTAQLGEQVQEPVLVNAPAATAPSKRRGTKKK